MGALATFTFRVACLSAVGACEPPPNLCHSLVWIAPAKTLPAISLAHTVRVKLEVDASHVTVKLAADVIWNVRKLWLVYLTREYYSYEDK
jgi:hypothetical protein